MRTVLVFDDGWPHARCAMSTLAAPFETNGDTKVVSLAEATEDVLENTGFLVVAASNTSLDGPPEGARVREWFATIPDLADVPAAAFAVRPPASVAMRCAEGVHRQLNLHRMRVIAPPGDFVADVDGTLSGRELERGLQWATAVARWFAKVSADSPANSIRV